MCVCIFPAKADPPLVVDANTVLASAISFQLLETIAWWNPEVIERFCGVNGDKLAEHDAQELGGKATDDLALEEGFGVPVGEALDHLGR